MQYNDPVLGEVERTLDRQIARRDFLKGAYDAAKLGLAAYVGSKMAGLVLPQEAYAQSKKSQNFGLVTITYPSDMSDGKIKTLGEWVSDKMMPEVVEFLQRPKYPGRQPSWEKPYTIDFDSSYLIVGAANLSERKIKLRTNVGTVVPNRTISHEYTHLATESGHHLLPEGLAEYISYIHSPLPAELKDAHVFVVRLPPSLIPLTQLVNEDGSGGNGIKLRIEGGSFVKFLSEDKGDMQKFMDFFLDGAQAYHKANFALIPPPRWNYERYYGASLETLEQEWLVMLRGKYALKG